MKIMNKKIFLVLVVVLFGGYFTVQAFYRDDKPEEQIVKNVKIEKVESGVSENTRKFSGVVGGEKEVFISPKVSGYVVEMKKKEGDFVRKGELLAVVDGADLNLQSVAASDNVSALKKVLEKTEKYYDQVVDETEAAVDVSKKEYVAVRDGESSSDSEISIAKKGYEKTKESLDSAKKLRDSQVQSVEAEITAAIGQSKVLQNYANNTRIIAPFDGVIGRKMASVGSMVSPSVPVYTLISSNKKEVEIFAPASVTQYLSVGQKVQVFSDEADEKTIGTVSAVSPSADTISRKSVVRISLGDDFSLGEFVVVDLPLKKRDNISIIPVQAVVGEYYEKFVFVARDGMVEKRKIEIGNEADGFVEVVSGVEVGEEIVVEGQFYLRDGDRVNF